MRLGGVTVWLLLCGTAFARTPLGVGARDVLAGSKDFEGEAHGRLLEELAEASTTQLASVLEVPVNPGVVCNVFPREAATFPNGVYRQVLQLVAESVAKQCSVPPPSYGKYIAQISTTCLAEGQTKLARSIRVGFKTMDVDGLDNLQGQCYLDGLRDAIDRGQYVCFLREIILGEAPDIARWTPVLPPGSCPVPQPP